jgi:hypothetical protein
MRAFCLILMMLLLSGFACAGGPEFVAGASYFDPTTKGTPLTWATGTISYYTDQGDPPDPAGAECRFVCGWQLRLGLFMTRTVQSLMHCLGGCEQLCLLCKQFGVRWRGQFRVG